jgi:hypothetical protein
LVSVNFVNPHDVLYVNSDLPGETVSGKGDGNADLIANEVGDDDGSFLPIRDGKWFFPPKSKR